MVHNSTHVLARCDQMSCRSEKGYDTPYDEYLKGNQYLTITAVDFSKRGLYMCNCDGEKACDVRLVIDTLKSSVRLTPGEALVMDLPVPDPVEVIYKPIDSSDLYGEQICTVAHRSLHCKPEYTHRASLSHPNITLTDVNMSDGGSYTIRDRKNEEDIHIYILIVTVVQSESERKPVSPVLPVVITGVLLLVLVIMGAAFVMKYLHVKRLKQEKADLEETIRLNLSEIDVDNGRRRANSDATAAEWLRQMVAVEKLIQRYKPDSVRRSRSWTNLYDIPELEMLKKKKAELDMAVRSRGISEQDTIGQWWSLKRPELNTIIERWRKFDAEPDVVIPAERCYSYP